jgi:hypothetical protein
MTTNPLSTRRDLRYAIRSGSCLVDLPGSGLQRAAVMVCASPSGFAMEVEGEEEAAIFEGAHLERITVRIGQGLLRGSITVRNVSRIDGKTEIGCLFYPAAESEDNWMSFLAGIEAARAE